MTKVIQIVGYKDSGKTTLMNLLIQHFSQEMKVGSLKHHGHGGEIELIQETDSTSNFEAGSSISGVEGESITQLTLDNIPFEELIDLYTYLSVDLLLIEGYKHANYPKIVLLKNNEEISLLQQLSNIIAVGTDDFFIETDYPTFNSRTVDSEIKRIASYIANN
ncbi:molybdopterin-guanine dinucleotide biosynthesis protein B [Virgibacillus flavescens]|uniref:molybdopterin-guanine dinucleotide biosynthesis protein B n=1 Tax=Virgibacillus flavescens TaxID=1611422 RepID=UPI003D34B2AE